MKLSGLCAVASVLKAFGLFWYMFIIGDDRVGAAIIIGGFAGTAILLAFGANAFWLIPSALILSVALSLRRFAHERSREGDRKIG